MFKKKISDNTGFNAATKLTLGASERKVLQPKKKKKSSPLNPGKLAQTGKGPRDDFDWKAF